MPQRSGQPQDGQESANRQHPTHLIGHCGGVLDRAMIAVGIGKSWRSSASRRISEATCRHPCRIVVWSARFMRFDMGPTVGVARLATTIQQIG